MTEVNVTEKEWARQPGPPPRPSPALAGIQEELRLELAVALFQKDRLTLAQASRLAGIGRLRFQHLLASRDIPVHYGVEDFEQDLSTLQSLSRA